MHCESTPISTPTGNPRKTCHPGQAPPLGSVLRDCQCDDYRTGDPTKSEYPCPHCGHACCWKSSIEPRT